MNGLTIKNGQFWKGGKIVKPEYGNPEQIRVLNDALEGKELEKTLDEVMEDMVKDEVEYLTENEFVKNEHGVFLYISADGASRISLDGILHDYKLWLIENKKVKPL